MTVCNHFILLIKWITTKMVFVNVRIFRQFIFSVERSYPLFSDLSVFRQWKQSFFAGFLSLLQPGTAHDIFTIIITLFQITTTLHIINDVENIFYVADIIKSTYFFCLWHIFKEIVSLQQARSPIYSVSFIWRRNSLTSHAFDVCFKKWRLFVRWSSCVLNFILFFLLVTWKFVVFDNWIRGYCVIKNIFNAICFFAGGNL